MASFSHVESRRMYSWWWDSHICPKHSKWLQEDLTDMDIRVKSMISLIEEDADSFARKAEMYYKKRPELMKLVEEFYRAYRALAERYNHATCALRQAHTMTESLLNEGSPTLFNHPSYITLSAGSGPCTPVTDSSVRTFSESGSSDKECLGLSQFHAIKRSVVHNEEFHIVTDKIGLKQVSEMFPSSEGSSTCLKFGDNRLRKVLDFHEIEGRMPRFKSYNSFLCNEVDVLKLKSHEDEGSIHSEAQDHLLLQGRSEGKSMINSNGEVQRLLAIDSMLNSEKEDIASPYQKSQSRIFELESEICKLRKLVSENAMSDSSIETSKEKCFVLEKEIGPLKLNIDALQQKVMYLQKQLLQKQEITENIKQSLQNEHYKLEQAEASLEIFKTCYIAYCVEINFLVLQMEHGYEMFKDAEMEKNFLTEDNTRMKEEINIICMETNEKCDELQKLKISMQSKKVQSEEAEAAINSLTQLYAQSQEELKILSSEREYLIQTLSQNELKNEVLWEAIQQIKDEKDNLTRAMTQKQEEFEVLSISAQNEHKRYLQVEEALESLKDLYAQSQEELKILSSDIIDKVQMIKACQSDKKLLKEDLHYFKCENEKLKKTIQEMQIESEKLNSFIKDETLQCLQAEASTFSMKKLYEKSQEELSMLSLQMENGAKIMNSLEFDKQSLEYNMWKVQEENFTLSKQLMIMQEELERLKIEKEVECMLYQDKASLEYLKEIYASSKTEILTKLSSEAQNGIRTLSVPEKKEYYFEKDRVQLKEKNGNMTREINIMQKELKELRDSLQDERFHSLQADAALQSLEKLYTQSQDDLNFLMLELQSKTCMLEIIESSKQCLEEAVTRVEGEMGDLNIQMESLRSENLTLKEVNGKLKYEAKMHADENEALQQEISSSRVRLTDLQKKHQGILDQVEVLELDAGSFQASYKLLRDENIKLKDLYNETNEEKVMLLEKIDDLEMLLEKNTVIESCLFDANTELEELKKKIKILEESCCTLHDSNSSLVTENSNLMFKMDTVLSDIKNVLEKNSFLQNALCDANEEIEGLKCRFEGSEESCLALQSENSNLQSEVSSLIQQVHCSKNELDILNVNHAQLLCKYSFLSGEYENLENGIYEEKEKIISLSNFIRKLKQEPFSEWGSLDTYLNSQSSSATQESLWRCILNIVKELWRTALELDDDRNRLILEEMIYITLLRQLALDAQDTKYEKSVISRDREVLLLQNAPDALILKNAQFGRDLNDAYLREEMLKDEFALQNRSLSDSQGVLNILDSEISNSLEESIILKKKKDLFEMDYNHVLQEYLVLDCQNSVFRNLCAERVDAMKQLSEKMASLHQMNNNLKKVEVSLEEKMMELVGASEILEVQNTIERNAAEEEMALANTHIDKISKILCAADKEKRSLTDECHKCLQIISSVWESFSSLEDHIYSRILHIFQKHETEVNSNIELESYDSAPVASYLTANEKLQKLLANVEALRLNLVEVDRCQSEVRLDAVSEDLRQPDSDVKESKTTSSSKHKMEMKDIQLDQVSNYSEYGVCAPTCDIGVRKPGEPDGQMLELWEAVEKSTDKMPHVSFLSTEILIDIEEAETIGSLSSKVAPAEILSFDQLVAAKPQKQFHDVWGKVIERLSSHAERLVSLQSSARELKKKLQALERRHCAKNSFEYGTIKSDLKLAEEAILQLIDKNRYAKKKAGECSSSENGSNNVGEPEEVKNKRKLVLQQTRRGSRKIGRLELKLQEMQYILVKHEEELKKDSVSEVSGRRSRVVLRDLLYGKETKKKAPHFCSCVETKGH